MGAFWALLVSVLIAWFTKGSGFPVGGKNETSGNGTQLISRGSFSYINSDVGRNGANGSNIVLESLLYGGYGRSDGFADHNGTADHAAHNGPLVASNGGNKGATGSGDGIRRSYPYAAYGPLDDFAGPNGTVSGVDDHAAHNGTLVASNGGNKGATGSINGILDNYLNGSYDRFGGYGGFGLRHEEQKEGLNGTLTPTTTRAVAAV
ncbi:uncharacterized protein ACO6RY_18644 [Pungitius sinensis]